MTRDWSIIWTNIVAMAGQTFYTKGEEPFTYHIEGTRILVSRTDYPISGPRNIRKALELWPVPGPSKLGSVRGASYIWGLLNDQRIVADTKWYGCQLIDTSILPECKKFAAFQARKLTDDRVHVRSKSGAVNLTLSADEARAHFKLALAA
jgi:hypothetical protein